MACLICTLLAIKLEGKEHTVIEILLGITVLDGKDTPLSKVIAGRQYTLPSC